MDQQFYDSKSFVCQTHMVECHVIEKILGKNSMCKYYSLQNETLTQASMENIHAMYTWFGP